NLSFAASGEQISDSQSNQQRWNRITSDEIGHIVSDFLKIFFRGNGSQCIRRLRAQPVVVVQIAIHHLPSLIPNVTVSFLYDADESIFVASDSLDIIIGKFAPL